MKRILFLFVVGLMIYSCLLAQSNKKLGIGAWRLQNSKELNVSRVLVFYKGRVSYTKTKSTDGKPQQIVGDYKLKNDTLSLSFINREFIFNLHWVNPNNFVLITNKDTTSWSQVNSPQDQYFKNPYKK